MSNIDDRLQPNAEAVGLLLTTVLADLGVEDKLQECRALLAWEEVAGEKLASQAQAVGVHRGRLQLVVSSSVWRTHLSFSKQQLLDRINQSLGERVLKDLVFVSKRPTKGRRPNR
ncbi:MAG: DUF721 domain-containing protein [Gemmatimonadetes bacterium]|nr:DUF721 domain-containing protein [Gemmatimonadota bacterium]MBT7864560.1 DUF721 domain-containing protein [Gemmatimonadota bacterium]